MLSYYVWRGENPALAEMQDQDMNSLVGDIFETYGSYVDEDKAYEIAGGAEYLVTSSERTENLVALQELAAQQIAYYRPQNIHNLAHNLAAKKTQQKFAELRKEGVKDYDSGKIWNDNMKRYITLSAFAQYLLGYGMMPEDIRKLEIPRISTLD